MATPRVELAFSNLVRAVAESEAYNTGKVNSLLFRLSEELGIKDITLTEFNECPVIPEAKEMILRTAKFMSEHPDSSEGTVDEDGAEVASIGHNYTFHTHPRGTEQPSDTDIKTTAQLRKEFLCIGLVPQKKVVCYTMNDMQKSCEHGV